MHLTVGVFGDQELAKRLGKKGTTNDIAIYNHGSSEGVLSYVCPNSEKIQSLLQVLNMIDVPVVVINNNITKEIGEIIIGIDEMEFKKGFIITEIKDDVQQFVRNTTLEKFEIVEEKELRQKLLDIKIERGDDVLVTIDNYFNVKGIGTVILGIVKGGKVNLHDKLILEPLGREITVKGIQSQDKDIKETEPGMRVGLNLKGVDADEIKRGFVLCHNIEKSKEIKIKFEKSRFFKQEISENTAVIVSVGLQAVSFNVANAGEIMELKSNQEIAYRKNQRCIVASQNNIIPRIIGSGIIL
jgi:selenocysteine-specific translation elongation factor